MLILTTPMGWPGFEYVPHPGLFWLISALTLVGAALYEEIIMVEKHGEKYISYREKTPFMLPLPKKLSMMITAPARVLLNKNTPENRKEIALVILVYFGILVLLSVPIIWLYPRSVFLP